MKKFSGFALSIAFGLLTSSWSFADDTPHPSASDQTDQASVSMSDGEIKRVDKDAGKFTIKHGPLANLDMPGMTMVFRVKEPAMLDKVKTGDKIRFVAAKVNGVFMVTTLEVVN